MATPGVPDGGDPNVSSPDRNDPQAPNRNGSQTGETVRKDGRVWEWNAQSGRTGWRNVRAVTDADRDRIPPAEVALDEGFNRNRWLNQRNGVADGAGVPDSSPGGGGGGGNGGGGGGNGGGAAGGGGGDRQTLRGIPDGGRIWKVGNQYFVAYEVPRSNPPAFIRYQFRDKQEAAAVSAGAGIDVARTFNSVQEMNRRTGAIASGQASLITNTSEHPFDRFRQDFRREVRFKPWLADPDFMALITRSILEGREPTLSEIQETDWYQSHSDTERQKLELYYGDRKTWIQQRNQAVDRTKEAMNAAGYDAGAKNRVADYLARELMFGRIRDDEQLAREIEQISNPLAEGAKRSAGYDRPSRGKAVRIDGEVFWRVRLKNGKVVDYRMGELEQAKFGRGADKAFNVRGGNEQGREGFGRFLTGRRDFVGTVDGFEATRDWVRSMIGPALMGGLSQRQLAEWAQRIDENPEAKDEIEAKLRKMRKAKYQAYDEDLSYEEIAAIPRAQFQQMWGRRVNERNSLFQWALQQNDETEVSKRLWEEGLNRGVDKVVNQGLAELSQQMGGGVRRSMV